MRCSSGGHVNDWHIRCSKCGEVIGVWPDDLRSIAPRDNIHPMVRCGGKGNHLRPREESSCIRWGIVEEFLFHYTETNTTERAYRYIGPPWWPILAFGFLCFVKREPYERYKKIRLSGKILLWLPNQLAFWKKLRKIFTTTES